MTQTKNVSFDGGDELLAISQEPVRRLTLATQVADRLIQLIGRDGLKPGDELPSETRLVEAFQVSRPVVREALRHLAALRMVELSMGKPARVLPVTPDLLSVFFQWTVRQDMRGSLELQELRRGIESMAAELAAGRATDTERDRLRGLASRLRQELGNTDAYVELDAELHLAIVAAAHNSLLEHLAESIRVPLKTAIHAGLALLAHDRHSLEEMQGGHEEIVDAIIKGDGALARRLMDDHIGTASKRIAAEIPPQ